MSEGAPLTVAIKRLAHGVGLDLPAYATPSSAGMDVPAAVTDEVVLKPGERALIPAGFAIALPPDHEAQIRPRSGLALRHGVTLINTPGTIDADYRGEIGVILINLGEHDFTVTRGLRIAQMVVAPVARAAFAEVDALPESARGAGGFGSTGLQGRADGG